MAEVPNQPTEGKPIEYQRLLRCTYLAEFIDESIVEMGYRPPVQLSSALKLTPRGSRLVNQIKGNGVETRDAQVAVFITAWVGNDLLIDPEETDIDTVLLTLSSEIKRKKLRLPWIYGRTLYDDIAQSTFHGNSHPTSEESLAILDKLPQGVFQLGPYLSGPYGLIEADEWRTIFFSHTVPGFHCEDVECDSIHGVHLSSGENTVDKALIALRDKLSKSAWKEGSDHVDRVIKEQSSRIAPYRWNNSSRLPFFLIDALSVDELRLLLASLLDIPGGALRAKCGTLGLHPKAAKEFVAGLDEACLLQIALLAKDSDIHSELNKLVWSEKIKVSTGEIRRSVIARSGSGPLEVNLELSEFGARFAPSLSSLPLRLQQVVKSAFPSNDSPDQKRLNWLLRQIDADSPDAKLQVALAESNPTELVERLLVSDEDKFNIALSELGLSEAPISAKSDRDIARLLTWHLGFAIEPFNLELDQLFGTISELKHVLSAVPTSFLEPADIRKITTISGPLFKNLERVLKSILQFSTWALLHDHYDDGYAMVYSIHRGRRFFTEWISKQSTSLEVNKSEDMTIGDLLTSLGVLGKFLIGVEKNRANHARPRASWPRTAVEFESPYTFPFAHSYPYLDLQPGSRKSIRETIQRITSGLSSAGVTTVRNKFIHDNDEVPSRDAIVSAIVEIEERIREAVGQGLYPTIFSPDGFRRDKYGRRRISLKAENDAEVVVIRPSTVMLHGFPSLDTSQIILLAAKLEVGGELLRFTYAFDSHYSKRWETDFPVRPARKTMSGLATVEGNQ